MTTGQLEKLRKIFDPKQREMNLVVFGSGSGTNLRALLKAQKNGNYKVRALFTDRKCPMMEMGEEFKIPVLYHSFVRFFKERGSEEYRDPHLRDEYDREVVELIESCAKTHGFEVDLIFLAGYMRVIHKPLLQKYTVVNVHPADLADLDQNGKRRFVGDNAVETALRSGEKRTRSCVHLVNEEIDGGPVLVSGPWVSYTGCFPFTKERVQNHQERQKRLSDWPAVLKAVELISQGRIALDGMGTVYVDEEAQSLAGLQM
jgi:folate-dependent phosphoribosylglycinamide formyltransferase PurN